MACQICGQFCGGYVPLCNDCADKINKEKGNQK